MYPGTTLRYLVLKCLYFATPNERIPGRLKNLNGFVADGRLLTAAEDTRAVHGAAQWQV